MNGKGYSNYRKIAFDTYPHHCAVYGWSEDPAVL